MTTNYEPSKSSKNYRKLSAKVLVNEGGLSESEAENYLSVTRGVFAEAYKNHTAKQVAEMYNVSESAVRYAAKQFNVKKDSKQTQFKRNLDYAPIAKLEVITQSAQTSKPGRFSNLMRKARPYAAAAGIMLAAGISYLGMTGCKGKNDSIPSTYVNAPSKVVSSSLAKDNHSLLLESDNKVDAVAKEIKEIKVMTDDLKNVVEEKYLKSVAKTNVSAPISVPASIKPEPKVVTPVLASSSKLKSSYKKLMAQYGSDGIGSAGIFVSGDKYSSSVEGLFGNESGYALGVGRNAEKYLDIHTAVEKVGDINDFVIGARKRFDNFDLTLNTYYGDLKGFNVEAEIPIVQKKNYDLRGVIGWHSLEINDRKGSGIDAGARSGWNINDRWSLDSQAMYTSDDKIMKEESAVRAGLNYSFGSERPSGINNIRIPYIVLNQVNLEDRIVEIPVTPVTPVHKNHPKPEEVVIVEVAPVANRPNPPVNPPTGIQGGDISGGPVGH